MAVSRKGRQPRRSADLAGSPRILVQRSRGHVASAVVRLGVCVRIVARQEPQVGVVPTDPLEGKRDLVPCAVGHALVPTTSTALGSWHRSM